MARDDRVAGNWTAECDDRFFLKIVTFPLSILTLGIFLLVINGLMILLASSIVRGFHVRGFGAAFWGAVVLALLGMVIRAVTKTA
jgi:putative membrane protein